MATGAIALGFLALGTSAPAQTTTLFFDTNGAAAGLGSGTAAWDTNTTSDWNAANGNNVSTNTTTPGKWLQSGQTAGVSDFNAAVFNGSAAGNTANVSGTVDVSTIVFSANANTIGGSGPSGTFTSVLNFGANGLNVTIKSANKDIIATPISGSGNIIYNYSANATFDLSSDMTNFTGNIFANNTGTRTNSGNTSGLQINYPLSASQTIYADIGTQIADDNPQTFNGVVAPTSFAILSPIVLNYGGAGGIDSNPVNNGNVFISTSNGTDSSGSDAAVVNFDRTVNSGITLGATKTETFGGVISSSTKTGIVTNVFLGNNTTGAGGRGTTVLAAHNTWNGSTTITMAANNGLVQMGIDNALPIGTNLIFGAGANAVAPFDLNGHSLTVGALNTGNTFTTLVNGTATNGNIYNTSPAGTPANAVTITIGGSTTSIFKGDIGCTNIAFHPFDNQTPYVKADKSGFAIQANTNVSLLLNGPGVVALAPISSSGNEYSGNTTVAGGTLVFGRTGTYTGGPGNGTPANNYTITGGGDVIVNTGALLTSLTTTSTTYAGGNAGKIVLNSGSQLIPGEANAAGTALSLSNIGTISTQDLVFNAGASMTFTIATSTSYDYLFLNGSLSLDDSSNANHIININATNLSTFSPGVYTLINSFGGIGGDSTSYKIGTVPAGTNFTYSLINTGPSLQLQVAAPSLRWDPQGTGPNVNETGAEWTDGSGTDGNPATIFYNFNTQSDGPWVNGTTQQVIIGNDVTQNGGQITLGSNISFNGVLTFLPIAVGHNYQILNNNGNAYTLTLGGGISVNNTAATSTTPSAEIDVPVVLSANQTWEVDPGQFLDVKGALTQSGNFNLTKTGAGTVFLESAGGSITGLTAQAGIVLLGASDAIGATTPITLNGGQVEFTGNTSLANPVIINSPGGGLGTTTGTLTLPQNFNTPFRLQLFGTGTVQLSSNNTFGTLEISGGTVPINNLAQFGGATTPLIVDGGILALSGINTLPNTVNIGTNGSANMSISDDVPLTLSGVISGSGNYHLLGSDFTLSNTNTNGNSVNLDTNGMTLHTTNAKALGTATLAIGAANSTIDVQVDVTANALRTNGSTTGILHKTGPGTLTFTGAPSVNSVSGSALVIDQGTVKMLNVNSIGIGQVTGTASSFNITANSGTILLADFSGNRSGGALTLNNATLKRDDGIAGETNFNVRSGAAGTSDIWTITGTSTIQCAEIALNNASNQLDPTVPIVVTNGSTLIVESDNTGGFDSNVSIDFRGPQQLDTSNATFDGFITFTIQAGATVKQVGPGAVRFGRNSNQGIAIVGQGTPGNDAVMKLGHDVWMTEGNTFAGQINTQLLVNSTVGSTAGLRIEAAMNAVYTNLGGSAAPGTTGLFGANSGGLSVNTIFSPARAALLSQPYTLAAGTIITPAGTLTLAANDAGGATGAPITAGPAAACKVTLALDNTPLSGNLVYQIAAGTTFGNLAGLVVERSNMSAGAVSARITGPTQVSTVTLNNGTSLDMANAMAVTGMTATSIRSLIAAGYSGGAWNGAGINSSAAAADTNHASAVGYGVPSDVGIAALGTMSVANTSIIVKYTYYGDSSLDGKVDLGNDFNLFIQGYLNASLLTDSNKWEFGDYNYDGVVTTADFQLFVNGYAAQGNSLGDLDAVIESSPFLSVAQKAAFVSVVPEPTSIGLLAVAAAGLVTRRRRRQHA